MLVVIANDLPPAIRGRMKLWFVEAKPNVFVSGVKDAVAERVIQYLFRFCSADSGIIIFQSIPVAPGYKIRSIGFPLKNITEISGLQLIIEKLL